MLGIGLGFRAGTVTLPGVSGEHQVVCATYSLP